MSKQLTHYDTLGVNTNASQDEIKKRFRELARQFHPDISKTPDASEKFKQINEANQTLSDPEKRANYDALLKLNRAKEESQRGAQPQYPDFRTSYPGGGHTPPKTPKQSEESFRTYSANRPNAVSPKRDPRAEIDALLSDAQVAYKKMRYQEAESFCRQALRIHRRIPLAYEILGDIQRSRNKNDEAIAMYSYALQLDKSNPRLQEKFDRMTGQTTKGPVMAGNASRHHRSVRTPANYATPQMAMLRLVVNVIGIALMLYLLFETYNRVPKFGKGIFPWQWDHFVIFSLAVEGLVCGLLLAINNYVDKAADEFGFRHVGRATRLTIPIGLQIIFLSSLCFYAACVFYVIKGFMQEAFSRSFIRTFGINLSIVTVFVVVGLFFGDRGSENLVLFAGNIVYVSMITGWFIGDLFKS